VFFLHHENGDFSILMKDISLICVSVHPLTVFCFSSLFALEISVRVFMTCRYLKLCHKRKEFDELQAGPKVYICCGYS